MVRWFTLGGAFTLAVLVLGFVLALGLHNTANAEQGGLSAVTRKMQRYQSTAKAEHDGWVQVPGLDACFDNPGVGGMGYHWINTGMLDTTLDETTPEALVYQTDANGKLTLGAVEWIVPAAAWDAEGHSDPPELFGLPLVLHPDLGVYALHAWLYKDNPSGLFSDWNPLVSCP